MIVIVSVDKKNNDLCKNKPQSQFMVGFGVCTKIQKEVPTSMWPSKSLGEKSYEIKGSSHEMAAMMLTIIFTQTF